MLDKASLVRGAKLTLSNIEAARWSTEHVEKLVCGGEPPMLDQVRLARNAKLILSNIEAARRSTEQSSMQRN